MQIEQFPAIFRPWLKRFRVDFSPQYPPSMYAVLVATVVAIGASLAFDAALVALGRSLFPRVRHYAHFAFSDYSKLTVIGIIIAAIGWPIVVRITSQPKWLYLRLAVIVSVVLLAPDVVIWVAGQPADGVLVLVWMHLAIAVVTYLAMITLAPVRHRRPA